MNDQINEYVGAKSICFFDSLFHFINEKFWFQIKFGLNRKLEFHQTKNLSHFSSGNFVNHICASLLNYVHNCAEDSQDTDGPEPKLLKMTGKHTPDGKKPV